MFARLLLKMCPRCPYILTFLTLIFRLSVPPLFLKVEIFAVLHVLFFQGYLSTVYRGIYVKVSDPNTG